MPGCVVPQELEARNDNAPRISIGLSNPPNQEFQQEQGAPSPEFEVVVTDPDQQTLYARAFIDGRYNEFIDLVNNEIAPPAPEQRGQRRSFFFEIDGLCDEKVNSVPGRHTLEVYISDSDFVKDGNDLRAPQPGGFRDSILWRMTCTLPLSVGPDAGS